MNRENTVSCVLGLIVMAAIGIFTWVDVCRPSEKEAKLACLIEIERACQLLKVQGDQLLANCMRAEALMER